MTFRTFGDYAALAVSVGAIWFISGWNPLGGEVKQYIAYCSEEIQNDKCPVREIPSIVATYKASYDNQAVVTWIDDGPPSRLKNCAVRNAKNWSCTRDPAAATLVDQMVDGEYTLKRDVDLVPDSITQKHWHSIPKWKWWLLKIY